MQCLQLENSTGFCVSMTVLKGWLERGGHVNPGAAALLCWLLGGCWGDSALVTLGVPTEPVSEDTHWKGSELV